jgi:hypothetical protein
VRKSAEKRLFSSAFDQRWNCRKGILRENSRGCFDLPAAKSPLAERGLQLPKKRRRGRGRTVRPQCFAGEEVGLYEFLGDIQSHVDLRVLGWQGIYNESEAGDNAGADFGPSYRP